MLHWVYSPIQNWTISQNKENLSFFRFNLCSYWTSVLDTSLKGPCSPFSPPISIRSNSSTSITTTKYTKYSSRIFLKIRFECKFTLLYNATNRAFLTFKMFEQSMQTCSSLMIWGGSHLHAVDTQL